MRRLVLLLALGSAPRLATGASCPLEFHLTGTLRSALPCECDFGHDVVASTAGVLVGQTGNGPGAVHLFDPTSGALRRVFTSPTALPSGSFGAAMAFVGDQVLVGDPHAPLDDDPLSPVFAGAAYLFARDGTLRHRLTSPRPREGGGFGGALAALGTVVAVSGGAEHVVYLFDGESGALGRLLVIPSGAEATSLGALGSDLVVGTADAVYLLEGKTGNVLRVFRNPADPRFAAAVVVAGRELLIGGAAGVYRFDGRTGALVRTYPGLGGPLAASGGLILARGRGCDESDVPNDAALLVDAGTGDTLVVLCSPAPGYLNRFAGAGALLGDRILVADPYEDTQTVLDFARAADRLPPAAVVRCLARDGRLRLSGCADEFVPDRVRRRIARAGRRLDRCAGADGRRRAGLVTTAATDLRRAARLVHRAAHRGTIGAACAGALEELLDRAAPEAHGCRSRPAPTM